jgi:hypothetical protein
MSELTGKGIDNESALKIDTDRLDKKIQDILMGDDCTAYFSQLKSMSGHEYRRIEPIINSIILSVSDQMYSQGLTDGIYFITHIKSSDIL